MPRYGDFDKLKSEFEWLLSQVSESSKDEIREVIERIDNAPTADVVEVVRCKDCKHHNETWCDMNSRDRGEWFSWYDDDFCSYGERRNDE